MSQGVSRNFYPTIEFFEPFKSWTKLDMKGLEHSSRCLDLSATELYPKINLNGKEHHHDIGDWI
jgi:hypothetical protein